MQFLSDLFCWVHVSYLSTWWRHQMETFSALVAICAGNSPVTGEFPHKGQWRGALMFSLMCAWINGWVNNREAGDLRRHRAHYGIRVMINLTVPSVILCDWVSTIEVTPKIKWNIDRYQIAAKSDCSKRCLVGLLIRSIFRGKNWTSASTRVQFFQRKIERINRPTRHVLL